MNDYRKYHQRCSGPSSRHRTVCDSGTYWSNRRHWEAWSDRLDWKDRTNGSKWTPWTYWRDWTDRTSGKAGSDWDDGRPWTDWSDRAVWSYRATRTGGRAARAHRSDWTDGSGGWTAWIHG